MASFTVVRGKRLRVTRLDECGNPPAPGTEESQVVTKGFVTVSLTPVVLEGTSIEQQNADGDLCVSDRSRDQFQRWDVEVEFCEVDPALLGLVTNVVMEEDYDGNIVGVRQVEGASVDTFALELWTGVPGTDCLPGEPTSFGYFLLPTVVPGPLGDITVENEATTFTVTAYTKRGAWGTGPYDVVPTDEENTAGPLSTPMAQNEHLLMRTTTIAPPEITDGADAIPDDGGGDNGGGTEG